MALSKVIEHKIKITSHELCTYFFLLPKIASHLHAHLSWQIKNSLDSRIIFLHLSISKIP